jgi:uncharacterized protein (DUF2252 family)
MATDALFGRAKSAMDSWRKAAVRQSSVVGLVPTDNVPHSISSRDPDDPLFLQVKEARRSVLEPHQRRSSAAHNGQRVVIGQRLMQCSSDIFLGWSRGPGGRDFYVRQLRDMKVAPDVEALSPRMMRAYATLCGQALARAHDKAGDAAMIAGYLGGSDEFDEAIAEYAVTYADQSARDYANFVKAIRAGELSTDVRPGQLEVALR